MSGWTLEIERSTCPGREGKILSMKIREEGLGIVCHIGTYDINPVAQEKQIANAHVLANAKVMAEALKQIAEMTEGADSGVSSKVNQIARTALAELEHSDE